MYTKNNLLKLLKCIEKAVENGELNEIEQERIYDLLTFDKNESGNKKVMNNLFLGWYINNCLHHHF